MYLMADYDEVCFEGRHFTYMLILGLPQIVLYALGLPLLTYVFLFRHRNHLDKPVVKFRYGLFFSGFRKEKYYWECIVALRKESTVVLAVFGPQLGVAMLAHVSLLVIILQLLLQLTGHPYDQRQFKLQILDVSSLLICWGTMWSGFFFYSPRPPNQKPALIFLTMLVVTVNALFMAILLYSMCSQVLKEKKDTALVKGLMRRTASVRKSFNKRTLKKKKSMAERRGMRHVQNPSLPGLGEWRSGLTQQSKEIEMCQMGANQNQKNKMKKKRHRTKPKKTLAQTTRQQRIRSLNDIRQRRMMQQSVNSLILSEIEIPSGWDLHTDKETGDRFFYNETTGESNWIDDDPIDNCRDIDIKIPSGWELHTDKETGDRFLYNETTGASNWIDDEISDHVYNNPMDNSRDIEIPSGWELHTDKETGDRFLYNETTGESRWVEDDSATSANNPVFDGANK